jgi:predicted DNA-binding transcriptional regulator AlpA
MAMMIYRANELYNTPAKREENKPAKRGKLGVGKSHFYEEIEPKLEKVKLGEKAVGYTDRSVDKVIKEGIAAARADMVR